MKRIIKFNETCYILEYETKYWNLDLSREIENNISIMKSNFKATIDKNRNKKDISFTFHSIKHFKYLNAINNIKIQLKNIQDY